MVSFQNAVTLIRYCKKQIRFHFCNSPSFMYFLKSFQQNPLTWAIGLSSFIAQFISFFLLSYLKNKIKVSLPFVVHIKCTILGFYYQKKDVIKRGFSWPFLQCSGIFSHFGPNKVLMNHRRRALHIGKIYHVLTFYVICLFWSVLLMEIQ